MADIQETIIDDLIFYLIIFGAAGVMVYVAVKAWPSISAGLKSTAKSVSDSVSNITSAPGDIAQAKKDLQQSNQETQTNLDKIVSNPGAIPDYVPVPGTGNTVGELRTIGYTDSDIAQMFADWYANNPQSGATTVLTPQQQSDLNQHLDKIIQNQGVTPISDSTAPSIPLGMMD